jgi:acetyl-CoA synthetase
VVTLMVAALYGVGLEPGDRYFCPSSPAWGHGLWHGTIAPLALGIHIATYSGKFDPARILEALQEFSIDNLSAAPTVFRMVRNTGKAAGYRIGLRKLSYTGEPMDLATWDWAKEAFGVTPCSFYGSTEVGVLVVNFPGFPDYQVKRGALGKAVPGLTVDIVDREGQILPARQSGEIAVKRREGWFYVKDRGYRDEEGYLYIEGRSDDVIISAGWTMSAVEIENTLLKHPAVAEAAVVGVPDTLRGQVAKAFIVPKEEGAGAGLNVRDDIQKFMKAQLSQHEYPRHVEFVGELPKTPAGKINRKALKENSWQKPQQ